MKKYFLILISAILCLAHLSSCNSCSGKSASDSDSNAVKAVVLTYEGFPLDSVRVSIADTSIYTDKDGNFSVPYSKIKGSRWVMRLQKDGYFDRILSKETVDSSFSEIRMVRKVDSDHCILTSFDSDKGITITVQKAVVYIPASSLMVEKTGADYNGKVKISVIYYNPDDPLFRTMFPGGDLLAINAKGEKGELVSYGMLDVEMKDPAGNKLQLKKGQKAQLTFPLPNNMKNSKPQSIPLWYFSDSTGLWQEDGISYLKGDKYVGSVSHFTVWNCDCFYGLPALCKIKVKVVDKEGHPCPDFPLTLSGGEGSRILYGLTDKNGEGEADYWPYSNCFISGPGIKTRELYNLQKGSVNEVTIVAPKRIELKVRIVDIDNNPIQGCLVGNKVAFPYGQYRRTDADGMVDLSSYITDDVENLLLEVCDFKMIDHPTYKNAVNGVLTVRCTRPGQLKVLVIDQNNRPMPNRFIVNKASNRWTRTDNDGTVLCYYDSEEELKNLSFDVYGAKVLNISRNKVWLTIKCAPFDDCEAESSQYETPSGSFSGVSSNSSAVGVGSNGYYGSFSSNLMRKKIAPVEFLQKKKQDSGTGTYVTMGFSLAFASGENRDYNSDMYRRKRRGEINEIDSSLYYSDDKGNFIKRSRKGYFKDILLAKRTRDGHGYKIYYKGNKNEYMFTVENGTFIKRHKEDASSIGQIKGMYFEIAIPDTATSITFNFYKTNGDTLMHLNYGIYKHYPYELVYSDAKKQTHTTNALNFSAYDAPIDASGPVFLQMFYKDSEIFIDHLKITDVYQLDGPFLDANGNNIPPKALSKMMETMPTKKNNQIYFEVTSTALNKLPKERSSKISGIYFSYYKNNDKEHKGVQFGETKPALKFTVSKPWLFQRSSTPTVDGGM